MGKMLTYNGKLVTYNCNLSDSLTSLNDRFSLRLDGAVSPVSQYSERVLSKMDLTQFYRFSFKVKGIIMALDYSAEPQYNRPYTQD